MTHNISAIGGVETDLAQLFGLLQKDIEKKSKVDRANSGGKKKNELIICSLLFNYNKVHQIAKPNFE